MNVVICRYGQAVHGWISPKSTVTSAIFINDIENLFQKLKQFRGIVTRYDKLAESYEGYTLSHHLFSRRLKS